MTLAIPQGDVVQRSIQSGQDWQDINVMVIDGNEFRRDAFASLLDTKPQIRVSDVATDGTTALGLLRKSSADVLIVDMNISPNGAVELVEKARSSRFIGTVVLTDAATPKVASELMHKDASGIAILERGDIKDAAELISAIEVVANRGTVIGPDLVAHLADRTGSESNASLSQLTPRERDVLARIAQGLSNHAIADDLGLRVRTVENLLGRILVKLGERGRTDHDGRVRAALFYLESTGRIALKS